MIAVECLVNFNHEISLPCKVQIPSTRSARRMSRLSSCLRVAVSDQLSVQALLISRFLLNLRHASEPDTSAETLRFSQFSAPNFRVPTLASFVGDLGEPVEFGQDHTTDEQTTEESEDNDYVDSPRDTVESGVLEVQRLDHDDRQQAAEPALYV